MLIILGLMQELLINQLMTTILMLLAFKNVNHLDATCSGGRCTTFSCQWASSTPAASVGTISSSDIIMKYDYKGGDDIFMFIRYNYTI